MAATQDVPPTGPVAWTFSMLVHLYRAWPRMGPGRCRFYPTCSSYALDALRLHGALRGSWLIVCRLGRCHPWNPGGIDYVPPRRTA